MRLQRLSRMDKTNPTHGGKRKGAGRKPGSFPVFTKKLRATNKRKNEFMSMLTGDARH